MGLLTVSVIKWGSYLSSRVPFSWDEWNTTFSGSFWQNPVCGQCQEVYKGAGLCALGTRVHFRSAPGHLCAQALEKHCLDTKCLNIDACEINVMGSGCEASPELMRESECPAVGWVLEAPHPQKACSGIVCRLALRFETSRVRESQAGTTWGAFILPSCCWGLVFNHLEVHSGSAFTTHSQGHILIGNS